MDDRSLAAMAAGVRQQAEDRKSPAEKLRDRLAYAARLRAKADSLSRLTDVLNVRLQRHAKGPLPLLRWRPFSRSLAILFDGRTIELDKAQSEQLFTWIYQAEKDIRANADRIEAELTKAVS